jgi:hypothetical protein
MSRELAMIGAEPEEDETPGEHGRYRHYDFLLGSLREFCVITEQKQGTYLFTRGSFEDAANTPPPAKMRLFK